MAHQRQRDAGDALNSLQRTLQPPGLPVHPVVRVDACCAVADAGQTAGGDWLDAVILDDGHLALVAGDVVGDSLAAAVTALQLRAVLRELLTGGADLDAALKRVDRYARGQRGTEATTMCAVVLDPTSGSLRYVTCGHPPPLVADGTGACRYLPTSGAQPLGTSGVLTVRDENLALGETLVLYTDGLISCPNHSLADGMAELARVAAEVTANPSPGTDPATAVAGRVAGWALDLRDGRECGYDLAVLTARRAWDTTAELHLIAPATPPAAPRFRRRLDSWLAELGMDTAHTAALHLAVTEAVTNAIEHAYPPGRPGSVEFHARLTADGEFAGTITDHGSWREPHRGHSYRGRGVALISSTVDHMEIRHPATSGTVVTMRHRLTRPVAPIPSIPRSVGRPRRLDQGHVPYHAEVDWLPTPLVRITGPIDSTNADNLDALLRTTARGGAIDLTVDLSGVTHLGSAGVRVLHRLAHELTKQHRAFLLVASPDSPADLVLDLVGLAHNGHQEVTTT